MATNQIPNTPQVPYPCSSIAFNVVKILPHTSESTTLPRLCCLSPNGWSCFDARARFQEFLYCNTSIHTVKQATITARLLSFNQVLNGFKDIAFAPKFTPPKTGSKCLLGLLVPSQVPTGRDTQVGHRSGGRYGRETHGDIRCQ